MFQIDFEDENHQKQLVWQNSWGLTTRTIGVMIMTHGDDKGLVLPPRVAPVQVVIIPIYYTGVSNESLVSACESVEKELRSAGIRVELDASATHNPGWKFANWELKGVPLRIELGPRDLQKKEVAIVRRDDAKKIQCSWGETKDVVSKLLETVQSSMYTRAKEQLADRTATVHNWEQFMEAMNTDKMALCCWCNRTGCEDGIKDRSAADAEAANKAASEAGKQVKHSAAKSLCIPFNQPELSGEKCFACDAAAAVWCLFGRSY